MAMIRKILIPLIALMLILVGSELLYTQIFYPNDLRQYAPMGFFSDKPLLQQAQVVYLGESSNHTFVVEDEDRRKVSDMVADYFPALRCADITQDAAHAEVYYHLLRRIPEEAPVQTVVVTMNLRSMGPSWFDTGLETALQKQLVLLKDHPNLLKRLLLGLKAYDHRTTEECQKDLKEYWRQHPLEGNHADVLGWADSVGGVGANFIKKYAFEIGLEDNALVRKFDEIAALSKARGWNLVFHILPINLELSDSLVGTELRQIIYRNRDLVKQHYEQMGVTVVDNVDLLPDSLFLDKDWPTEHFNERGRRMVAERIAQAVAPLHAGQYRPYESIPRTPRYHYEHHCEDEVPWGGFKSLTFEKSYSGQRSSVISSDDPFGTTLELWTRDLPKGITSVDVGCWLYQPSLRHDGKLALELSGSEHDGRWEGKPLQELNETTGRWVPISYTFELDSALYKNPTIKIYVMNTTPTKIYVDDVVIDFR